MITTIIPTLDDEAGLAMTLAALVPAVTEGIISEAIVVDAGSKDGTLVVADVAGCTVVRGAGGDGLRHAAELARSEWLLFLAPSSVLEANWQGEVLAFLDQALMSGRGRESAAAFRLGRVEAGFRARRAEWLARLRSRLFAAPYGDQGLLLSRAFYRSVGGHRALPAMESVDLSRRIGRRRLTLLHSRAFVRSSSRKAVGFGAAIRNAACLAVFVLRLPPRLIGRFAA
ncbi:MAG: glycosyltransferase [Acetobacterales bacterium]